MQVALHVLALIATGLCLHPFVLVDKVIAETYITQGFDCRFDALHSGRAAVKNRSFIVNSTVADRAFSRPQRNMDTHHLNTIGSSDVHIVAAIEERSDWAFFFNRLSATVANKISLMAVNMREEVGRMCLEIMIREGMVDVVIPLTVGSELSFTKYHTLDHIEQALATPFLMPARSTIDKNNFTAWMRLHGYGDYVPRSFSDLESVTYPSIVKHSGGEFGIGTTIVYNITSLKAAVGKLIPQNVLIQEAITGQYDLSFYFIARQGRLLSTFCGIFPAQSDVFVRGVTNAAPNMDVFRCTDLDAISPFFDVMQSILRDSRYNGGGCFDLKVVKSMSDGSRSPVSVVDNITRYDRSSLASLESDFSKRKPYATADSKEDTVIPIIFELNNRICANIVTNSLLFNAMIRAYLTHI